MKINVLPKHIYDKIAAGEVIENPLSVVKELVENSIDADATFITVDIKDGGKSYIRVSDNGSGINKDDINTAFLPHATSKLDESSDLTNISSLGFRGEALTSIAAVSEIELVTKTENEKLGTKVVYSEGKLILQEDCASEVGTSIIVNNIFFNLPARKKFLKSDSKEASNITEFVSRISLAYPNIKFRMINNGTILFTTPGKGDVYQTILTVYSPQNARKLLNLDYQRDGMRMNGYISSPLESKTNKRQQIVFVNGRLISSKVLDQAISLAYQDKLFEGRYPSAYLFLDLDPAKTDVNVHPRKSEIKFFDDDIVREFAIQAIRKTLLNPDATQITENEIKPSAKIEQLTSFNEVPAQTPSISYKTDLFKQLRDEKDITSQKAEVQEELFSFETKDELKFSNLRPINQIFGTYILAVDNNNFYIIDQHAAHERIMFEHFLGAFNKNTIEHQVLLKPILIDLSASQMLTASESLELLSNMGFGLELFGDNSYIVKEIPYFLDINEAKDFVNSFFETADELKTKIQINKNAIISKSCKAAVKSHDKLSEIEILKLLEDLDKCDNPFSCPHGRPTFIKISEYELEKMFRRK